MLVRDLIKNPAVCTEDFLLEQVYKLMQEKNEDHVVVIDSKAHKIPIGVVTEHEICMQVIGRGRNPRNLTAANVMNADFVKVDQRSSLSDYRLEMREGRRILVVDENGSLQGVLPKDLSEERASVPERPFKNVVPASSVQIFDRIF
jgi:CBS domain-containing protein